MPNTSAKAKYWIATIPQHLFVPYLPTQLAFIHGQLETAPTTSYLHWQLFFITKQQCRLSALKKIFGDGAHFEPTRSEAAEDYCLKDDTAVLGTRFSLGTKPLKRNCPKDWDEILCAAKESRFEDIPADVYIRCHSSLKKIAVESAVPVAIEREVYVFWGATGCGKSHTAWEQGGLDSYPKDPCTKFWDGYRGQEHVIIDEFRGTISISHILRWLDRYPVLVEIKGSSVVLKAKKIWITSNLHPKDWYPQLDQETTNALLRRLTITHFQNPFNLNQ